MTSTDTLLSSCAIWSSDVEVSDPSDAQQTGSRPSCTVAAYVGGDDQSPRMLAQVRVPEPVVAHLGLYSSVRSSTANYCAAAQGFSDGSVLLCALALLPLTHVDASNPSRQQLTLACHAASVSALLHHRWQPAVAAVPLEVLVTGVLAGRPQCVTLSLLKPQRPAHCLHVS